MAFNPWTSCGRPARARSSAIPAARGWLDVVLSYPGLPRDRRAPAASIRLAGIPVAAALSRQRRALFHRHRNPSRQRRSARASSSITAWASSSARRAKSATDCTIYQGVTLGGTSLSHGKRHPTLGRNVTVGVNSACSVRSRSATTSKSAADRSSCKDVPANATVVGVPARVVAQDGKPIRVGAGPPAGGDARPDRRRDRPRLQRRRSSARGALARARRRRATVRRVLELGHPEAL